MKAVAALRKLPGRELTTAPDPIGDSPSPTSATHDRDGRRDSKWQGAAHRLSIVHRFSVVGAQGAAGAAAAPSTAFDSSLLEERCRRCLAAAVEPSLLREREWADGLKRATDDLAAEIVELGRRSRTALRRHARRHRRRRRRRARPRRAGASRRRR